MKKKKGYTLPELLILIAALALITIVTVTSVSFAFDDGRKSAYEDQINYILKKAEKYGQDNLESVKNSALTLTVEKLIEKKYLATEPDGRISDPRNDKADLNDLKIKITFDEKQNKAIAKVVE